VRYRQKTFIKIPYGEIQYGHVTGSIVVWFRGRKYRVWTSRKKKRFMKNGGL
jgi:hypothetical protein